MKKIIQISAAFLGMLMAQNVYSDTAYPSQTNPNVNTNQGSMMMQNRGDANIRSDMQHLRQDWRAENRQYFPRAQGYGYGQPGYGYGQGFRGAQGGSCGPQGCCAAPQPAGEACCGDRPTGECYCMYVRYNPCYYCVPRCVEEQIPCQRKCWRYVPRYYEVERCRYVPQYYKETYCRQEPECYYVQDCKTCKKIVYDQCCDYTPEYYWKHTCGNPCAQ